MTGCRHNAKNTLPKNYLALAETAGARVYPMTTVTGLAEREGGGFTVDTVRTGTWGRPRAHPQRRAGHRGGRHLQHPASCCTA